MIWVHFGLRFYISMVHGGPRRLLFRVTPISSQHRKLPQVDKTVRNTTELFDYLSKAENEVSEALRMIRTVRLGKFKGTKTEMYLIQVMLAHSPKHERMIIQQKMQKLERCNEILKELISYHRASPNVEIKYT